ncbi:MAG: cardiolipin synthase ClsB [Comamonadaceae bacterium]|nr:MAG: cardiolipin synthase ClsB [Comamonadaceae bacterium]
MSGPLRRVTGETINSTETTTDATPDDAPAGSGRWTRGNAFRLLENGEEFFPAVFKAIDEARHEVILETFILFEDKVGEELHRSLLAAARRGVSVDVMVDAFGSPDLSREFIGTLTDAGVRIRAFDPGPKFFGWRTNMIRRMHRKIVVIDGQLAFIGGINYSADHLADFGPEAKQDYSVEMRGPLVDEIHSYVRSAIGESAKKKRWRARRARRPEFQRGEQFTPHAGNADAMFLTRDNSEHKDDIERHYRLIIRAAKKRVVIANAYFFPGYRLLREMRRAARRGVEVSLILQGQPDMPIVKVAAELLYGHLIKAGVRIFEYCDRPLHGKVAVADYEWATVGSSNLDPLSLALNLEANVAIRDRDFNAVLFERLDTLMRNSCKQIRAEDVQESGWWSTVRSVLVFHALRHYPTWANWLPTHAPKLTPLEAAACAPRCPAPPLGNQKMDAA